MLAHPDFNAKLGLFTDASEAIGGVLQQLKNGHWQPLAFFSRKLSSSQKKYSAYDRELLAIYENIKYFRHWFETTPFTIYTDHKPLCYAFRERKHNCSPRQFRHLDYISQFSTDIQHVSGKDNAVADTLSRVEEIAEPVDLKELAEAQGQDAELADYLKHQSESSLRIKRMTIPGSHVQLFCDVSTPTPRPFVPKDLRKQVSHPGANASAKLVAQRYVWPQVRKDCREWSRACLSCQRTKVNRHTKSPLGTLDLPSARFKYVHIDLIGPLPPSREYRYCFTAVDRFTRWAEVVPIVDITAESVCKAFLMGWVARFGCPTDVVTDRGKQFESATFQQLSKTLGFKHRKTTAYHPQGNGLVERFHRQLKSAIMCHTDSSWSESLPLVLLGVRSSFKEDLQTSSSELVYGEPLRLPGEFFGNTVDKGSTDDYTDFSARIRTFANNLQPTPTSNHSVRKVFVYTGLVSYRFQGGHQLPTPNCGAQRRFGEGTACRVHVVQYYSYC